MQTELFEHGIFAENSDIRAHVAPGTRSVYVCRTQLLQDHIRLNPDKYRIVGAGQIGVAGQTSKGYAVVWSEIPDIRRIRWDSGRWWERFSQNDSTTTKGKKACGVVGDLLRLGRFPLWYVQPAVDSKVVSLQHKGTDLLLCDQWRIQVKCDWNAGEGGTGNLYIETHERNPLRRH